MSLETLIQLATIGAKVAKAMKEAGVLSPDFCEDIDLDEIDVETAAADLLAQGATNDDIAAALKGTGHQS